MTPRASLRGGAILRRLPQGPVRVTEVGVFVGALSRYLLDQRHDMHLIMVDDWAPTDAQPTAYKETGDRHALQTEDECRHFRLTAKRNVHRHKHRITILNMRSSDAAKQIEDGSLDLVFLDADHSEEGLAADLIDWEPKVKPGGWIGGHDFDNVSQFADMSGVKKAVMRWLRPGREIQLDQNFTWFSKID